MTHDIYAIGNALVDLEFQVTDAQLEDLEIQKSQMTLIDAHRRSELLAQLSNRQARRTGGGSAANTVVALQQLGGRAYYACRVADDAYGHFYADDLTHHGVQSCIHKSKSTGHTGTCLVMITPDAERTMSTHLGVSAELCRDEVEAEAIASSSIYYMEGYLAASPTGLEAALVGRDIARRSGAQLALTLSDVSMIQFCRDGLLAMLADGVDYLFANEAEIKAWLGTDSIDVALREAGQLAKTVCITLGAQGCAILQGEVTTRVAAPAVQPVDTNGAGDMFAGAFLYACRQGRTVAQAAQLATAAASAVVAQQGNRMPTPDLLKVRNQWLQANG